MCRIDRSGQEVKVSLGHAEGRYRTRPGTTFYVIATITARTCNLAIYLPLNAIYHSTCSYSPKSNNYLAGVCKKQQQQQKQANLNLLCSCLLIRTAQVPSLARRRQCIENKFCTLYTNSRKRHYRCDGPFAHELLTQDLNLYHGSHTK